MSLFRSFVRRQIFTIILAALTMGPAAAWAKDTVTVGGPFRLKAPDGTTITDQTYRGQWLLVYFGYTSCPDSCPTALLEIATALKQLGPEAAALQPIFITIDPQRDTPNVIEEYVQSFDRRIVGLSGTTEETDAVARAYGAYSVRRQTGPDAQDYFMDHSVYIYLMNPQGTFVRAFDTHWLGDRIASAVHEAMSQFRLHGSFVQRSAPPAQLRSRQ